MFRWLLLAVAPLLFACGDPDSEPPLPATLQTVEQHVFGRSCSISNSCHAGDTPRANLNLSAPVHEKIVGVPSTEQPSRRLVVPGDPAASYLYEKLSHKQPSHGVRMPPGQPLSSDKLDLVRRWIEAGALDD